MKTKNILMGCLVAVGSLYAQDRSGHELFNQYCAKCHADVIEMEEEGGEIIYITKDAPYVQNVVKKLKSKTKSKDEFINYIKDYIQEPNKRKSLYGKRAIKKFGIMPSLKGIMSDEEITKLATYLYDGESINKSVPKMYKPKPISVGEKVFNQHCATCHLSVIGVKVTGIDNSDTEYVTDKAPYLAKVLKKLKKETHSKEEFAKFIHDYIQNPDKRKSIYGKKAIKKFGVMPSLKGAISDDNITKLTDFLYSYPLD
jgi:mono/diheme cytochrome c family protein